LAAPDSFFAVESFSHFALASVSHFVMKLVIAAPDSFFVPASTLHDAAKALLATSEKAAARIIDFMGVLLKDRLLDSSGPAQNLSRLHGGFKTRRANANIFLKFEDGFLLPQCEKRARR
jgi:hypothetical protein